MSCITSPICNVFFSISSTSTQQNKLNSKLTNSYLNLNSRSRVIIPEYFGIVRMNVAIVSKFLIDAKNEKIFTRCKIN